MAMPDYLMLYTKDEVRNYNTRLHRNSNFYNWQEKILTLSEGLNFDEEHHKYTFDGMDLPSVTNLIKQWQVQEDWVQIKKRYAKKNGVDYATVDRAWSTNSVISTNSGTHAHNFAESCFYFYTGAFEGVRPEHERQIEKGMLLPNFPKEEAVCRFWNKIINEQGMIPMLAETKVHTCHMPQYLPYAGTFDLLMYYKSPQRSDVEGVIIMDWKTNKALRNDYSRSNGKMLLPPFNDMFDEDESKYTLQLSAYQLPLAELGIPVLGRRLIHLKDDGNYDIVPVADKTQIFGQQILRHEPPIG